MLNLKITSKLLEQLLINHLSQNIFRSNILTKFIDYLNLTTKIKIFQTNTKFNLK